MTRNKRETEIVKAALERERRERLSLLGRWTMRGHITVLADNNPGCISIQCDTEVFSEARDKFPTSVLIARLQLALGAGQSENNHQVTDEAGRAMIHHINTTPRRVGKSELLGMGYGGVTATVIPRRKNLMKARP